jgi:2-amino-4-hydroxy-6-hydroxymethyldihydropteridine diphosphokinase
MSEQVFIALGSNLGDRLVSINSALDQISGDSNIRLVNVSSIYETDPVGPAGQGKFLNAAAELETRLSARELLNRCLQIEAAHGRLRDHGVRWGPRSLDIDLLLYGRQIIDEQGLRVPHPHMASRQFVLIPLVEIAGDVRHPITGRTMRELLLELPETSAVEYQPRNPCFH